MYFSAKTGKWMFVFLCIVISLAISGTAIEGAAEHPSKLIPEELAQKVDASFGPPCDVSQLVYDYNCHVLGPNSNSTYFVIAGQSGYRTYRCYYFYADSGSLFVALSGIDSNTVYCCLTVYHWYEENYIDSSSGGPPELALNTTIPEIGWYFAIVTTYGCGPWDDQQIGVTITHEAPDYDLRVSSMAIVPQIEDAHPDTGIRVYFTIDDVGEDPIPYDDIDLSGYFIRNCQCEYEYAYPVTFSVYAGKDIRCDNTTGLQFSCFQDNVYLGGNYYLTTSCPDTIKAPYSACSKIWNVLARVDPSDLFHETNEENNCSLVTKIGWAHHINGELQGYDWNVGTNVSRGLNGLPIYAYIRPGPCAVETTTRKYGNKDGYFDFWVPYSVLRDSFHLDAFLDKSAFAVCYDSITGGVANMISGSYSDTEAFSAPVIMAPYTYTYSRTKDSIFNAGANGIFGIEDFNSFISGRLGQPYALPFMEFSIGDYYYCFAGSGGIPLIRLGKNIDTSLYYDRRVMHELAHAVHYNIVDEMGGEIPGCGMHGPGMFSEGEICAYIEGLAGFMQTIVPTTNAWTFISQECGRLDYACLDSNNIEHNDWLDDYSASEGQDEEGAVATVLYDLYDTYSPFGGDDGDPLRESFTDIYSAMAATYDPISILQYANRHMAYGMAGDADGETRIANFCQ
jgi:hypothetical protein